MLSYADMSSKKPAGSRPKPRRLLSLDTLRKGLSNHGQEEDEAAPSNTPFLPRQTEKAIPERGDDPFADAIQWTKKELVTSPELQDEDTISKHGPPPLNLTKSNGDASEGPASPSRRRWDTIRHHVLPSNSSAVSIPSLPSRTLESYIPDRPSTPRLHKFGQKKQFQQLVNAAQVQHHDHKRFTESLWKAGWTAHTGDSLVHGRPEREPTLGVVVGSSLHLPFMASTASLQPFGNTGVTIPTFPSAFKNPALRRPQSVMSVSTISGAVPSVNHVARVLASTSSMNRPRILPHENLVLSALLTPFVTINSYPGVEGEQATAVETFELVIRTYRSPTIEVRRLGDI
jgi:hypothetical protein